MQSMQLQLNARSPGAVGVWASMGDHQKWTFEPASDGYFRLRSVVHAARGSMSYLGQGPSGLELCDESGSTPWAVELHGRLHFVGLVEQRSGQHLTVPDQAPGNGTVAQLVPYTHGVGFLERHWHLVMVPSPPEDADT